MKKKFTLIVVLLALVVFMLPSCATGVSQEEYESVRWNLRELQVQNQSLEAQVAEIKGQLAEARQNLENLSSQLLTLQSERDKVIAERDTLNLEVAALREQLSSAPQPAPVPAPPLAPPISPQLRRGQYLVAQDHTFLGILDSEFASDSIFNDFGEYGSEFSSTSIFNDFSEYGSPFSSLSAFNDFAGEPPMLFEDNNFICYVTTNSLMIPRVSPYSLIAFAESMGWK